MYISKCCLYLFITSFISIQATGNQSQNATPMLLYSTTIDIRIISTAKKGKPMTIIRNLTDGAAIDYHYEQKKLCWTNHDLESVQCVLFDPIKGNAKLEEIEVISTGIISPDGLACDWFTNNLYWTDSNADRIEVASMSTRYRKVLFWTKTDQPRAIALDPMQGLMFWTDWGEEPKIERAGMDGNQTTRKVIVSSHDIFWPNGLTLDYENKRIYWIDGKLLFLKSMNYNGEDMLMIIKNGLDYPFALTYFQNKLYWSDWKRWSIYVNDRKIDGKNATREFIHSDVVPMDIHIWDVSRQPVNKTHGCALNNGGCSHLCLLSPNPPFYSCACQIGIKLISNMTCADGPQEMLLLATRSEICVIYLDSPDYTRVVLNLTNIKYSIAVDYDPIDKHLFWTDTSTKKIQRAKLDGSDQTDIVDLEIESSDGIAVDWVARNIYWTDSGIDRIEVARLDGSRRKVLIYDGLLDPRAIVVAPNLGWIFWSDWNDKNPKIERANLDATERMVIVSENLGWANGIALDLEQNKIYWCDAQKDRIEFANMDGSDRRILASELPHPFGFSLLGNFIYWTDWQKRVIYRVHKESGISPETILEQIPNMMGIKAIRGGSNYLQDAGNNPCGINNGGCEHFCFYRHNKTHICVCQIGYELTQNKHTCKTPDAFLIYTKDTGIGRISIENEYNHINLPINGIKNATSADYHVSNNRIYWSDSKLHAIMRSYINGSDVQKVVELGITAPEGLAVDWVALNIYWTDPATHKIEVARLDGSSRRVLLFRDVYVEPHSIALDPQQGFMYWTEWAPSGNPAVNSIKKAAMDGSNAKKLVVTLGFATGLTLDYEKSRVYWTEMNTPAIISSDMNGLNKIVVIKEALSRPLGLVLYKDFIYWTDVYENKGIISAALKTDGTNRTTITTLKEIPTDLLLIRSKKQDGFFNQCAVDNGGCSHLCLALPAQSPGESTGYTCACPTHYTLQNNTCTPPKRFMIYSQRNLAVRLLPDTSECLEAVLPIQGLKGVKAIDFDPVLQFLYWIGKEGKTLLIKRAKAIGTHTSVVIAGGEHTSPWDLAVDALGRLLFWSCSIQDVINVTRLDNGSTIGVVVQVKGEKPRLLALHPTKRYIFYTDVRDSTQTQIVRTRMDGSHKIVIAKKKGVNITAIAVDIEGDVVVWAQGSSIHMANIDGENQHEVLKEEKSPRISQLTVHSGWLYWLDRDLKRRDLTGVASAAVVVEREHGMLDLISVTEPNRDHKCSQIHTQRCSHLCIMNGTNALCACPLGLRLEDNKRTCAAQAECGPEYFTCSIQPQDNKDCVPLSWKCDGQMDCQDSSDEVGCPYCRADQFRCHSGECIDMSHRCDDRPHCKDKSDEERCCRSHEFQCPRTDTCIALTSLCDGIEHCADGEDEKKAVCSERLKDIIAGMGLPTIVFCIALALTAGVIILIAFYYFKNSVKIGNVVADQSEDPLNPIQSRAQIKALKMRNKGIPDVVHMSMLKGSPQSLSYDRDNITGASSSTNSSSVACYPRETLNPPPSPATTAASTRGSSPSSRYRPYKHYRSINQPPPPTPCSTDICDESDYNYPTNQSRYDDRNRYDAGPFPPPPTPKSHCHTESCPPSPSSRSSTYFSPLPPPPSPVASPPPGRYDS